MANQRESHEKQANPSQQRNKDDKRRDQQHAEDSGRDQQGSGQRGGSGNFAEDPQRASEAGRKGGKK